MGSTRNRKTEHWFVARRRDEKPFTRQIFRELGFKGAELEMRTHLYVGYHSWERITFPEWSKEKAKRLIKRRVEFFTRP